MRAIVLSIGDELVLGQTVDTNSAWLSSRLSGIGCEVVAHITVGDNQPAIEQAIREAAERVDALIISGGIGPTPDDLTRQALAAVMGVELEMNAVWLARLEQFFARLGRPMPQINTIQAMIPRGARMIDNSAGTAAGIAADLPVGGQTCRVFVMPGVPKEMKIMFEKDVRPQLDSGGATILSHMLHTFGLGESAVAEKLGDLMRRDLNPSVGTTVSQGIVSLRINARATSHDQAIAEIDETLAACRAALRDLIFGQDDQTLPGVVAEMLRNDPQRPSIVTAESCTGGLLAKMLTDVAGSSAYFERGWVTYSNAAKTSELGVPAELIDRHGAVSEPVVRAMAEGARGERDNAIALSISGIAGPDGGTAEKPVGTVCIGLSSRDSTVARRFHFSGDREMIRDRSAKMALTMLRFHLLRRPMPF